MADVQRARTHGVFAQIAAAGLQTMAEMMELIFVSPTVAQ